MLHELHVENLLLMERAELRLAPGLNVLTGETGTGKTLLAHALDLLLGGRARSGIVRAGAAEAYVEGVFSLPPGLDFGRSQSIPADAQELVLARRIWPDGRTRAYVCGRSATVADLRELGSRLLAFYGQHEHRKLMLSAAQLDVLDAYCGPAQLVLRSAVGHAYERVRALGARVTELRELAGARERELDLLAFELDEIEGLEPSEQEAFTLTTERDRLGRLDALRIAAAAGAQAISPDGGRGVCELLAEASEQAQQAAGYDPELQALAERLRALRFEAEDLGGELRSYLGGLEAPPGQLEEVEERLAAFARLQRKHGGSIADVLRHAERCRARCEELEHADVALAAGEAELAGARAELDRLAGELGEHRRRAAPELAAAVSRRLAELAMAEARFEVVIEPRPEGCGPRGAEVIELWIAPNAGVPAGPLREIASGGELSRVMLALLSVSHADRHAGGGKVDGGADVDCGADVGGRADVDGGADVDCGADDDERGRGADTDVTAPLLVFDEIDAGIGGQTARVVGEHLRALSDDRQILCITHLPQVAALAGRHFTISKDSTVVPARTTVTALHGKAIVGELVRMLGAGEGDLAASRHARQLLRAA
ncbi:MAG: DNA repair protein RecN [Solirubrobacteraceae bacterium]